MWKKIIYLFLFVGFLSAAGFISAQGVIIPNPLAYDNFKDLLLNGIIPAVAGIIGALSAIMIIVAGILYLTSAGNTERLTTAKKALIYAIAGIVIALLAETIVLTIKSVLGTS